MEARIDAGVLWARALALGSIAFFLGVVGHVSADGLLPGPTLLVVLLLMSVALSAPMLHRQASPLRIVALLVGGQTTIHLVLTVTAGHVGDPSPLAVPHTTGPGALPTVDGHRVGSLQDAYAGMTGSSASAPSVPGHLIADMSAHAPMMGVHLVAAVLVGLWLGYGERLLWNILTLTGRRLLALVLVLVPVAPPTTRAEYAVAARPRRPRSRWVIRPDSRRGPPLLAA